MITPLNGNIVVKEVEGSESPFLGLSKIPAYEVLASDSPLVVVGDVIYATEVLMCGSGWVVISPTSVVGREVK